MSTTTAIKCIEAGLDNVDTSISSMSMTYGHSATETLVGILKNTKYDTKIDLDKLVPIATHFRKVRKKYAEYEGSLRGVDARIISSQVPGGMLTNLENQLKEQNAIDRFDAVIDEIPNVRADLGFIPLVTPTSQIVGTQAVINVLNGERYKTITKETAALLKGEYGATPAPVDSKLQSVVLNGDDAITCRPADLLGNNEFDEIKKSFDQNINEKKLSIENSEENILTYALFPEVGIKFFENINNPDYFENAPLDFTNSDGDIYKVTIEDKAYFVKYSKVSDPEILDQKNISNKNNINTDNTSISGEIITAPLSGNIFSIVKNNGESVGLDDTVIVLEAMKMETTIKTPLNGIIKKVFVKNGDKVNVGDPLFEVI
jgi:oxaloacetate decarboxylase alpha subunit